MSSPTRWTRPLPDWIPPYIDLLLIHQPAGNYIAGYRQMEKAYKEGKVRAIGLSNFNKVQIEEILSICEVRPTVLQTELHPYHQEPELKAFLKESGIVPQAWYPLGHGDKALIEEPLFAQLGKNTASPHRRSSSAGTSERQYRDPRLQEPGAHQGQFRPVRLLTDGGGNGAGCRPQSERALLHQHPGNA